MPHGQHAIGWFAAFALVGIVTLSTIGAWYARHLAARRGTARKTEITSPLPGRAVALAIAVLMVLIFSKFVYMASLFRRTTPSTSFINSASVCRRPQLFLFAFLMADGGRYLLRRARSATATAVVSSSGARSSACFR